MDGPSPLQMTCCSSLSTVLPLDFESNEALKRLDVEREPIMFGKHLEMVYISDDMNKVRR